MCLYVSLSVCLSSCQSVCHPVCLSVCHPVCLSVCHPVCLSPCLSPYLSVCHPICLSVCHPICVSVCHPITCRSLAVYLFRKLQYISINEAGVRVKCRLFLSDFDHIWMQPTPFWHKSLQYQVGQNSVQWEPSCYIRTDRRRYFRVFAMLCPCA